MKDLAIYGLGGFGREVACVINLINEQDPQWNLVGYFDDGKPIGEKCEYGKVIGDMETLNKWETPLSIVIAIGKPQIVASIVEKITNRNIDFPNIVAPDCKFYDKNNISLGRGNIICPGCQISCNVRIRDFNILNSAITIGHDVELGSYNSLMPGVRLSGFDKVGSYNFFGVSSVVIQYVSIGNEIVLGANSVLMKDTKEKATYMGNPARAIF